MLFEKQIVNIYKKTMFTRCDDDGTAFYFSASDFAGLCAEPYTFKSSKGHDLVGYFYHYADPKQGRLVVFDHGFGGGHRSYIKEIEYLCKNGYLVFAYDHTGCMESGGDTANGMAQSICDLNDCITALKSYPKTAGLDISVMGHSWGGFSTLNIAALHPDISHIVVLSGFVSVEMLVESQFSGLLKGYRRVVMAVEEKANPEFVKYNAVDVLKHSNVKALLIYSDNDAMVRKDIHFDALKSRLDGKPNIKLMLVSGKGHNPNYTADAVRYLGEFGAERAKLIKKAPTTEQKRQFVEKWDFDRMTTQDDSVWGEILAHLLN